MDNHERQTSFEQIQTICRDFRRKLKSGLPKRIEDYLDRVYEPSREMLFQNLLHVEIEFRRRQGEQPESNEYAARFPDLTRLVRQAFFESTMMSMSPEVETPADEATILYGMPAARKLGDYELLRELGRGGFGVVYEARHLQRGEIVAIKTLPIQSDGQTQSLDDAERLHRFRREFRSLSEINHPNLVGMQSLEVDGRQWFFTMDLVDGVDFLEYVRPHGALNETRLRESLGQLVAGILALHHLEIVHRDLKPSNVFVSADGLVTIMDFGLVAELQVRTDQTISMYSKQFAGTPRYAAPEQTLGVRSTASDWYAMGVMLYEALTGEVPFTGSHVDVIVQKRTEDAPKLRERDDIPVDLAELVDHLLQREPEDRPHDDTLADQLGIVPEAQSLDSIDSHLSSLSGHSESLLVGRESQLLELEQTRQELLQTRQSLVVFISGRSGEGKTSLAEKFLQSPRLGNELLVLSGRCYDRESVPFKVIDCLIDALVAYLRVQPTDEVHALLPDDVAMLAQLFPVLRRVEAIATQSPFNLTGIDSRQIRFRAFAALRELLISIGTSTPLILFVDDLQWGDADSASAMAELLKPPGAPAVMLLGTYRSDEAESSPFIMAWRENRPEVRELTIEVAPLSQDECAALFAARLGVTDESLCHDAAKLYEAAQGNPYFLEQLLEGYDHETGRFQPIPLQDVITRRLERLPDDALPLLESIAIAGQAVRLDEVAHVAGDLGSAFATITHMRSERLVRLIGSENQQLVDTYHDKIRETVLAEMDPQRHRRLHWKFGEYLEQSENLTAAQVLDCLNVDPVDDETAEAIASDRIVDLAYHFYAAGDSRAFAYQFMAGELAYRAYSTEEALTFLRSAETLLPKDATDALRYRLLNRLGNTLIRLKSFTDGLDLLHQTIALAPSSLSRTHTFFQMGVATATIARYDTSLEYFDMALAEIGSRRRQALGALFTIPFMAARVFLLPHRRWSDSQPDLPQKQRALEQRIHYQLVTLLFEKSPMGQYYSMFRLAQLAADSRNRDLYVEGTIELAGFLILAGLPRLGRWQTQRVADISSPAQNSPEIRGELVKLRGLYYNATGELQQARRDCEESFAILSKAGAHWQASFAIHLARHVLQVVGNSMEEADAARKVIILGKTTGDFRAQCWGQYDLAGGLARAGQIEAAKQRIEKARVLLGKCEASASTETIFLATEAYVLLQASEYGLARATAERSWRLTKRLLLFMEYNLLSLPVLIACITGPKWVWTPAAEKRILKRLLRSSWMAMGMHPNLKPHVYRVHGRAFWTLGKHRKAIRSFQKAIECAENIGADYDRARSLLDLAAVQVDGRDERRQAAIELLKKQESVLPWAERWLLGDQFDEKCVAPPS
ncbi:serine/threonine-protein kinase [Thalassoroseus pseudoceratinae]|uniref:serine/threonine-protein kinase n=1 Tax=Thalassoroseus pseudoceratinae TaxID=2713176 RepID=UPI0014232020|nr:serine/threonine-protein kinase [Thalassoroseus pseudoceratinae]